MDSTIKDFIRKAVQDIHEGLPEGYEISDEIEFDISVVTTVNKKGGMNIKIASGEIDKEKQTVHSINFGVVNPKQKEAALQKNATAVIGYIKEGFSSLLTLKSAGGLPKSNSSGGKTVPQGTVEVNGNKYRLRRKSDSNK